MTLERFLDRVPAPVALTLVAALLAVAAVVLRAAALADHYRHPSYRPYGPRRPT